MHSLDKNNLYNLLLFHLVLGLVLINAGIAATTVGVSMATQGSALAFWLFACASVGIAVVCASLWSARLRQSQNDVQISEPKSFKRAGFLLTGLMALWVPLAAPYGTFTAHFCLWLPILTSALPQPSHRNLFLILSVGPLFFMIESAAAGAAQPLSPTLAWLVPSALAFLSALLVASSRQTNRRLEKAQERWQQQEHEIALSARQQERRRLAREVHDGVGNALANAGMQLDVAALSLPTRPMDALSSIQKARDSIQEGLVNMRLTISTMAAGLPDGVSLIPALEDLGERMSRPGFAVAVQVLGSPHQISHALNGTLYRCAQEGLTNVIKHSGATQAIVTLKFDATGAVSLTVADNGCGIPPSQTSQRGLAGMKERVRQIGGDMRIAKGTQGGALIQLEFVNESGN